MRKVAVISFLLLSIIIGGILFWQWSAYSQQHDSKNKLEKDIVQEIVIETTSNKLNIKQSFSGITENKEYKLHIPNGVNNLSCQTVGDGQCQFSDEKKSIVSTQDEIILSYSFSIERNDAILLTDWSILLDNIDVKQTKLEIAETIQRDSIWLAGAQLIGNEKLELIDYFVFEGIGQKIPLYWQNSPLTETVLTENIVVYSKNNKVNFQLSDKITEQIKSIPTTIVLTDKISQTNEKGLIIINPQSNDDDFERQLVTQYFLQLSDKSLDPSIYDVLASLSIDKRAITKKGKVMKESLTSSLSEHEINSFIQTVINKEVKLDDKSLDKLLAKIKGLETNFFEFNNESKSISLLYFYEPKQVVINDEETDLKIIVENNKRQFPFVETMKLLGFEVNNLSEQILLTKKNTMMRFYLNKNIFILNEEDYGLLENPLKEINGEIYIEQKWLKNIFNINVNEEEEHLYLNTTL